MMTTDVLGSRVADELLKIANGILAGKITVDDLRMAIHDHTQKFTGLDGHTYLRHARPATKELNFSYTERA